MAEKLDSTHKRTTSRASIIEDLSNSISSNKSLLWLTVHPHLLLM